MPITKRLTIDSVDLDDDREMETFFDQVISAGVERVRAEGEELRRRGLMDEHGNLLLKELPADMQESSQRDFGG